MNKIMKRILFLAWLIFKANFILSTEHVITNGVCWVNINLIKKDAVYCVDKKQKLDTFLANIDVQLQLFKDQANELDAQHKAEKITRKEHHDLMKALSAKCERLNYFSDNVRMMYDNVIESRINSCIKEIIKAEHFSACVDVEFAIVIDDLFDITHKVIHKMDMKYMEKETESVNLENYRLE